MADILDNILTGLGNYASNWVSNLGNTVGDALQPQNLLPYYLSQQTVDRQTDIIENYLNKSLDVADPFNAYRSQYAGKINDLYNNPSEFLSEDPGYQFRLSEGQKAVERSAASGGFLQSGNLGTALTKYGQDMATQEYQSAFDRLARLAGVDKADFSAASVNLSSGGTALADLAGRSGTNLGNLLGEGQAQGLTEEQAALLETALGSLMDLL